MEYRKTFSLNRRCFLRGAGVAMALPFLEAMTRPSARRARGGDRDDRPPKRMIAVCNNLGLLPDRFFPEQAGTEYGLSPYLTEIGDLRDDFTVFSGVSHPDVDGSHASDVSFLSAAPHPGSGGFRNSISLDQFIALRIGHQTRFPSLTLGVNAKQGRRSLSFTGSGALIPCEDSASEVYQKLFLQGSKEEVDHQIRRLKVGQSIMDTIAEQAKAFNRRLGSRDRHRMDQYVTAVRDVENRLVTAQQWERTPKPAPSAEPPTDPPEKSDYLQKTRLMYQMANLAFQADSTRSIALLLDSNNSPTIKVEGATITDGYHNLSHHGKSEKKLKQLDAIDRAHMRLLGELLTNLKTQREGEATLLDNVLVMYGSNFGDANTHVTTNMPILLAGGGFRHGGHLAFDRTDNHPLPNLFVSMLQQMGIEVDRFASSTGTMRGLEVG